MTDAQPPLISIALCTFNGERFLREQLDSLLAQDWPHIEIVAVDDASTDGTPQILASYAGRNARIRYTRNAHNRGYQKNFEAAISLCSGRWIAPCDQDDIWLPRKLSELARELATGAALLAYCDSELMDENGRSLNRRVSDLRNRFSTDDPAPYLLNNNASGHAMLFCRSLLGLASPFPPSTFHDWWLAYVAASAGSVRYVDECLVRHRQHATAVTNLGGAQPTVRAKARGFRRRDAVEIRERIELFSRVPGKGQAFAQALLALWRARETQFISPRLAVFAWRHRQRLFAIQKSSEPKRMRQAAQLFWGLRTKQMLQPHRYAKSD
ncbi:MAG: glycosyltransferase family 2 protein [Rhizobacter sp.]|nr:glycosyltransferase family 2 protein [Rhizobacter sp.]